MTAAEPLTWAQGRHCPSSIGMATVELPLCFMPFFVHFCCFLSFSSISCSKLLGFYFASARFCHSVFAAPARAPGHVRMDPNGDKMDQVKVNLITNFWNIQPQEYLYYFCNKMFSLRSLLSQMANVPNHV